MCGGMDASRLVNGERMDSIGVAYLRYGLTVDGAMEE